MIKELLAFHPTPQLNTLVEKVFLIWPALKWTGIS